MKNRIRLIKDNKGSGIVTVLLAVVFLALMGSLLLMLTFTGFEMKASDRKGKQSTYDASTVMDSIKLGIQQIASEAIEKSYSKTLGKYSKNQTEVEAAFDNAFQQAFFDYKFNNRRFITNINGDEAQYDLETVRNIIRNYPVREGNVRLLTTQGENKVKIIEGKSITFKNIKISYDEGGRTTTIKTDIVVSYPNLGSAMSRFNISGLPSFSAVAAKTLEQGGSTTARTKITGGAYMGKLNLTSDAQLEFQNGVFICAGDMNISGSYTSTDTVTQDGVTQTVEKKGRLVVDADSTLWSRNIIIHNKTNASFLGNTLLANDLNISGKESDVTLSGSFNGFGSGERFIPEGEPDATVYASESSAILINGKKNKLDIRGLSDLTISGCSFIGESPLSVGPQLFTPVRMGESLSVKENQRAYLVPEEFVIIQEGTSSDNSDDVDKMLFDNGTQIRSNPEIIDANQIIEHVEGDEFYYIRTFNDEGIITKTERLWFDKDKILWEIDGKKKTFKDYNASLQIEKVTLSGQTVVYVFVKFGKTADYTETENADRYFKDYFVTHPQEINSYIDKYFVNITESNVQTKTIGNVFTGPNGDIKNRGYLTGGDATGIISNSRRYQTWFFNVCRTLTYHNMQSGDPGADSEKMNPFTFYINVEKIKNEVTGATAADRKRRFVNEDVEALIINGDYTYSASESNSIHLIIATGDVTVEKDFRGLIMCGGNMILKNNASLIADSALVGKAYSAIYTGSPGSADDRMVKDYFKIAIGINGEAAESSDSISNISGLVTYANWKKN